MMMQWTHPENPPAFTVLLPGVFEIRHLHYHAQVLYQEYSADDGYHQFLPDDDGQRCYDATQCKAAGIAHEYLCRERIVPQEPDTCPYKSSYKNAQLSQVWYVHDVEIFSKPD